MNFRNIFGFKLELFDKRHLKKKLVILASLFLLGCQSSIDLAGEHHALVFNKWRSLYAYAAGDLVNRQLIVVAKLGIDIESDIRMFKLTDIRLAQQEKNTDINLLQPTFEHKYICIPICMQLAEFYSGQGSNNETLLTEYFSKHEYELFKFYGEISLLNDQLISLKNINDTHITTYLTWLAMENKSFDTLPTFVSYLKTSLSVDNYIAFINDAARVYSLVITPEVTEGGLIDNIGVPHESLLWAQLNETAVPHESLIWTPVNDTELMNGLGLNNNQEKNELYWKEIRKKPVNIGDTVCIFENNSFGVISEINGASVTVNLVGIMEIVVDGLPAEAKAGEIFFLDENHIFLPMSVTKKYQVEEVASCNIA